MGGTSIRWSCRSQMLAVLSGGFPVEKQSPDPVEEIQWGGSFLVPLLLGDEDGAEGGDGDHQNRGASLHLVPEELPDEVKRVNGGADTGRFNDSDDDHDDTQTHKSAYAQLLTRFDTDIPEKADRY